MTRSAEVLCSGNPACGGRLCGDPLGPAGLTNAFEAVCSGKPTRDARFFGDGKDPLGHTLSSVGTDDGV